MANFTLVTVVECQEGRMAEWSKVLVLGTSHLGGVGLNPTPVIFYQLQMPTMA